MKYLFMRRFYRNCILALVSLLFFQCQKEISDSLGGDTQNNNPDPITAVLQGNVLDENGKPAMGVTIKTGTKVTTTNARGYFRIPAAPLDKKSSLVIAEKAGYYKAYRSFSATSGANQVVIKLIKKNLSGTINASSGGEVTLSNGAKVALRAGSVVQESSGVAYTGAVQVFGAYIDPMASDIAQTVPGSFMADDKDNNRVTLQSYGMMAVELLSSSGQKLQVKAGTTAILTTPIPASALGSAPATIALWYVDEQTGIWKEEGTATKSGNNYVGEVKHFSFWNCDVGIPAVKLTVTLKTNEGIPVVNTLVRMNRAAGSDRAESYGITDSLGQVSGLVPKNESFVLHVLDFCNNSVYSQNIGPFTQDTDIGVITVNASTSGLVTLKGKLLNCSGAPVANGYSIIYYNNATYYAATDASGNFSRTFTQCLSMPPTAQILGIDAAAQQQGSMVDITIMSPLTNAGTITACGSSSLQYINYNLDDTLHTISTLVGDTIMAIRDSIQGSFGAQFYGYHGATMDNIRFQFTANASGTFPLQDIGVNPYWYTLVVQPFDVVVTNYPSAAGQYWEGTFTGQFKNTLDGTTQKISGSFRNRKQ